MEQDKNFDVRLKASIDKRIEEAGIWNMVLDACKDYDEYKAKKQAFMDSLNDITLNKLQGIKAATPSPAQPPVNGEEPEQNTAEKFLRSKLWSTDDRGMFDFKGLCTLLNEFRQCTTPPASPAKAEQPDYDDLCRIANSAFAKLKVRLKSTSLTGDQVILGQCREIIDLAMERMQEMQAIVPSTKEPKAEQEGPVEQRDEAVEWKWDTFWKGIVCHQDGTINIDQVKKELHDFSYVMAQVPKVYCHITGDKLSKIMYPAETVIAVADDHLKEIIDQELKDYEHDAQDFLEAASPRGQEGPWKYEVHHVQYREDAEEYATISDGKVTLYIDGGEDDGDEQRAVDLLNRLKITLDYDREAEHVAFQLEEQNKELYAEIQKREQEGLRWVSKFEDIMDFISESKSKISPESVIESIENTISRWLESAPKEAGQVDPVALLHWTRKKVEISHATEWLVSNVKHTDEQILSLYLESLNKQP